MIKPLLFLIHGVFDIIIRKKKLTFWEISVGVNFICFPRNDEKFDFWPWKWGVDLYTRLTYTRVNTVSKLTKKYCHYHLITLSIYTCFVIGLHQHCQGNLSKNPRRSLWYQQWGQWWYIYVLYMFSTLILTCQLILDIRSSSTPSSYLSDRIHSTLCEIRVQFHPLLIVFWKTATKLQYFQ